MLLAAACAKVRDGYCFIPADELRRSGADAYVFRADLSDTTSAYSTYIAARLDPAFFEGRKALTLEVLVTSPGGESSAERFDFPLLDCDGKVEVRMASGRCADVEWPYRDSITTGSSANAPGIWTVTVKPVGVDSRAVLGMGFRYSDKDGKR